LPTGKYLLLQLRIHKKALDNFAAGGRCLLRKNRIVAAEARTLAQYGPITLAATNNGGMS
jgi:hypothetical protein